MTPPKKWPQKCEDTRMDCVAMSIESAEIIERLMDMVHGDDILRLLHKVSTNCLSIQSRLNEVKGHDIVRTINEYLDEKISEESEQ